MQACVSVHVCKMLGAAVQANKQNGHKPQSGADHKAEHKPEPAAKKEEVHVGSSIGMSGRNPLDLIKTDAPLLSEAKTSKSKRALAPLLDAAGRDEACVWYRVRPHVPHHVAYILAAIEASCSVLPSVHVATMMGLSLWCTFWVQEPCPHNESGDEQSLAPGHSSPASHFMSTCQAAPLSTSVCMLLAGTISHLHSLA